MSSVKRLLWGGSHRSPVDDDEEIVLLVLGLTGTGKSFLIQSLMGEEAGPEISADGFDSCTVKCDMYRAEVGGVKFALIDTPGMQTGSATIDTTLAPIKQFLDKNPLVKIHGILFTTPAPNTRTFGFEVVPLFILRAICGKPFFSNLTVVVTNGDVVSPALLKSRLYEWRRTVARWTPGCKVRAFDRGNPGGMLSHYSGMKRKGILENKAPLLVTELRGHQPEPALTTAGKAAVDGKKWRGDLRDREAWARKLRGWVADARYSNPPRPNARSQPHS